MKYRVNPKNNDKLSVLGFGCMRFPKDDKDVEEQIIYAIENGVNYFDTAYVYPKSEVRLGKVLAKGYRERVKLATKLPHYMIKKTEDLDRIFNEQLNRLQTDYIDYYFIHMLTDVHVWERVIKLGILTWLEQKRAQGQVINVGFSYHGGRDDFIEIIDAYDWDFCMIQYNYLDEYNQAGKSGLQYAASKGLPVMIMEPLRGGKLVTNLPQAVYNLIDGASLKRSPAEWALRWVWNHSEVTVVLSGMNSMEMLKENIRIASEMEVDSFTEQDVELFTKIRNVLEKTIKVACTGCNYCLPCPAGVDIPTCFACYNDIDIEGRWTALRKYLMQTSMKRDASNAALCIKCGKCEQVCPQKIAIRTELDNVVRDVEGIVYKPARFVIKRLMKFNSSK